MSFPDSARRFSDRVADYVLSRPGYPEGVLDVLQADAGLTPEATVADVGSGTGISAEMFLRNGNTVVGIEPNIEMRHAAERLLSAYDGFSTIDGTAEATTLPTDSVDLVVAGQAFHWFHPTEARREFARVLRPDGCVALFWNVRLLDVTPFLRDYEALLQRFGTDYREVMRRTVDEVRLRTLFAGAYSTHTIPNTQRLTLDGLRSRLLSSSYTPAEDHPDRAPMLAELSRIFETYEDSGVVCMEYHTKVYVGRVS